MRTLLARGDQQLLGARVVEQAFLREHADLDVERPLVGGRQSPDGVKALQADAWIDLDVRAHQLRAANDRLLERANGAGCDVVFRERPLDPRGLGDGLGERALRQVAAVDDAGLVEVDVGLDEARQHEPAADGDRLAIARQRRLDRRDASACDADVERRAGSARRIEPSTF